MWEVPSAENGPKKERINRISNYVKDNRASDEIQSVVVTIRYLIIERE